MTIDITQTVAFVTGTNRKNGIGRAIVEALLQNGAQKVYATARDASSLTELVELHKPGKVVAVSLDVTDKEQVSKLGALYPDVTLVVNNAGYAGSFGVSVMEDSNIADIAMKEIMVNYIAPMTIIQAFATNLKSTDIKNTAAVVIASIASLINFPLFPTYSASKAAAHSLTQAIRCELKDTSLVMGVYPGPIDTDMAENVPFEKDTPSAVANAIVEALKTGKEDVYPDATAVHMHDEWQADAKATQSKMS